MSEFLNTALALAKTERKRDNQRVELDQLSLYRNHWKICKDNEQRSITVILLHYMRRCTARQPKEMISRRLINTAKQKTIIKRK